MSHNTAPTGEQLQRGLLPVDVPVELIPRAVLFGNPERMSPAISPDGTRLGFVAPVDGVLNVWVGPADDFAAALPVTRATGHGVTVFAFAHDDRTLLYLRDQEGDENWRLYALDLDSGDTRLLSPEHDVHAQILAHNQWHPNTVLVGLNAENPELHDVYSIDLRTGESTKVEANPGFVGWLIDSDLQVRGGTLVTPDGGTQIVLKSSSDSAGDGSDNGSGDYELWREFSPDDATTSGVVGYNRAGDALYLISSKDAQTSQLIRVDQASGDEQLVGVDAGYDVTDVIWHPETLEAQAYIVAKDRDTWVYLDDELAVAVESLRGRLRGDLSISRRERSGQIWLVTDLPSDGPVSYYLYNRGSGSSSDDLTFLFAHKPELNDYALAPMEPFEFTARDGLVIHGYLTYPVGQPRTQLPAVLNVHGGPWARDSWGYEPEAQWMANRGYLCVQVNFRGSTGYGKAFGNAGDKQWGAAMHHDLLDAVDYLAKAGALDPARVCIYGGSYGGYAALAGAAFTPDAFTCAVDIVGPSNLLTLLESLPEYWKPMLAFMNAKVGNIETERALLWQRSPLSAVEAIKIPLLIAHGANDPRVKQAEAEQIVAALRDKGIDHEYLLFPDEGHGLARPENRETFYAAAEAFLGEHLGGRVEVASVGAAALSSTAAPNSPT